MGPSLARLLTSRKGLREVNWLGSSVARTVGGRFRHTRRPSAGPAVSCRRPVARVGLRPGAGRRCSRSVRGWGPCLSPARQRRPSLPASLSRLPWIRPLLSAGFCLGLTTGPSSRGQMAMGSGKDASPGRALGAAGELQEGYHPRGEPTRDCSAPRSSGDASAHCHPCWRRRWAWRRAQRRPRAPATALYTCPRLIVRSPFLKGWGWGKEGNLICQ